MFFGILGHRRLREDLAVLRKALSVFREEMDALEKRVAVLEEERNRKVVTLEWILKIITNLRNQGYSQEQIDNMLHGLLLTIRFLKTPRSVIFNYGFPCLFLVGIIAHAIL